MKRLARFLKITSIDAGKVIGFIVVVVICIILFVAVAAAIFYGIGGFANWIMGNEFVSYSNQTLDGLAVFMLIAIPCFFLFLVIMAIIYFCKWIADSWRQSGAWR